MPEYSNKILMESSVPMIVIIIHIDCIPFICLPLHFFKLGEVISVISFCVDLYTLFPCLVLGY